MFLHLDHVTKIEDKKGNDCKLPDHEPADQVSIYFYFLRKENHTFKQVWSVQNKCTGFTPIFSFNWNQPFQALV